MASPKHAAIALGNDKSRPLIGITTSDHKSLLAWWCDWISVWRAGGRPVLLPDQCLLAMVPHRWSEADELLEERETGAPR